MNSSHSVDLVIFDMDGVIFQGRISGWTCTAPWAAEAEAWRLCASLRQAGYRRLAVITAEQIWNGRDATSFQRLIASRRYVDGAPEVIAWLRRHGVHTAIVSSGPHQLAERARDELGIEVIRANRLAITGAVFAGTVELQVDDTRKDAAAKQVMTQLAVTPARTAMVGDSASDAGLAGAVGRLIAYDPAGPELSAVADSIIPAGHLRDLIDLFAPADDPDRTAAA